MYRLIIRNSPVVVWGLEATAMRGEQSDFKQDTNSIYPNV